MRYDVIDQATRDIIVGTAMLLQAGRVNVIEVTPFLLAHFRGGDDPRLQEAIGTFVAVDSLMDDMSAGALPYMTESLRVETKRKLADLEASYRQHALDSAARFISVLDNEELAARVARILIEAWDPMDVGALAAGQDFYDDHVPGIRELLRAEATEVEFADHLLRIEDETLQVPVDRPRAQKVARLLIESAAEFRAQTSANVD